MEYQQIDHCARYIGIGQVEYRAKEVVVVVHKEVQPTWYAIPLEQREVEHIDNLAHHKGAVALAKRGYRRGCRSSKNHTIEHRVDKISYCARQYHSQSDNDTFGSTLLAAIKEDNVVAQ